MASSVFLDLSAGQDFIGQQAGPAADNTAAPPFSFLSDLTTGYGSSAAGVLDLMVAGAKSLELSATAATFLDGVIGSFAKSGIAVTSTTGFGLRNVTAATVGVPVQMSPRFLQSGTAYNSVSTLSETNSFFTEVLPATVAGTTTATFKIGYIAPGGAVTYPMTLSSVGGFTFLKILNYNNVATAGWGVPAIQAAGRVGPITNGTSASITTYTNGAADGSFEVSANCLVTTSTTHSFSLNVTYTDESNAARVLVLPVAQLAGTFVTTGLITNLTGVGPYESALMHIRVKASTTITVQTSSGGTYTGVVYNAEGVIKQMA